MDFNLTSEGDTRRVELRGRFTFADNKDFREVVAEMKDGGWRRCVLDMRNLDFIDSAGLGMLLLARDVATDGDIGLIVHGPRGQVRKMLDIAKFDEILTIE